MKSMPHINVTDKVISIVGGCFLLVLVLSSWFPSSCPLMRKVAIGCPTNDLYVPIPQTPAEQEISRIPHQTVPSSIAYFSPKSDTTRNQTSIGFEFRELDTSIHPTIYLQAKEGSSFTDIALVTQPLLASLTWSAATDGINYRLYEKSMTYSTIGVFMANLPPSSKLAADDVAARRYGLKTNQYQDIETLKNLDGISYILTSYQPPEPDGSTWHIFRQTLDLSLATPDANGDLNLALRIPSYIPRQTLFLGTIDIDFARADRPLQ